LAATPVDLRTALRASQLAFLHTGKIFGLDLQKQLAVTASDAGFRPTPLVCPTMHMVKISLLPMQQRDPHSRARSLKHHVHYQLALENTNS